jgi:hypothetical protein
MTRPLSGRTSWREQVTDSEPGQDPSGIGQSAGVGLLAGMALGFAGFFGGFWAFLLVAVLGAAGLVAGLVLEGRLDLGALLGTRAGRR